MIFRPPPEYNNMRIGEGITEWAPQNALPSSATVRPPSQVIAVTVTQKSLHIYENI